MLVTYIAKGYKPELVIARYVRRSLIDPTVYSFCAVGTDRRYAIRQGLAEASDLPEAVRLAADQNTTVHYVNWPLGE